MNTEQFRPTSEFLHSQGFSETIITRFFSKITITPCCWLWTGYIRPDKYGRIWGGIGDKMFLVHRVSWLLHCGAIPEGLDVLHDCPCGDTERCVNPAHLWVGTHADNIRDMIEKGHHNWFREPRDLRGENSHTAVLTNQQVIQIRAMAASGVSQKTIRTLFGMSCGQVSRIINRQSWTNI